MIANYHTHTRWCRHGSGEIEDYVKEGIRKGLEALAITEHVPHPDRYETKRMQWDEFGAFNDELDRVIRQYGDRIHLIKGFECEYYPDSMDEYRMFRDEYGYTLMILGQHSNKSKLTDYFKEKKEPGLLEYTEEVLAGLNTGFFDFLAHPDVALYRYTGSREYAMRQMSRIFAECERLNVPVEINANGYRSNRGYPDRDVWEMSKDYRLTYLINSDAHHVRHLCDEAGVGGTERFAKELGIEVTGRMDW